MSTKICQICGQEKPAEAFSKSYRNRCRDCVAEQTRRQRKDHVNGRHANTIILDDPILPDFLKTAQQPEDKWEDRHYRLSLALFFKLLATDASNAGIAATRAKSAADKFINIMQDNDQ